MRILGRRLEGSRGAPGGSRRVPRAGAASKGSSRNWGGKRIPDPSDATPCPLREAPGSVPVPGDPRGPSRILRHPADVSSWEMLRVSLEGAWERPRSRELLLGWDLGYFPLGSSGKGQHWPRGLLGGISGYREGWECSRRASSGRESIGRSWSGIASRDLWECCVPDPRVWWNLVLPSKTAGWRSEDVECGMRHGEALPGDGGSSVPGKIQGYPAEL